MARHVPGVTYAAAFRADAAEVWDYIGAESPDRADAVIDAVTEAVALLVEHPRAGRARDELGAGVRSFAVPTGRHVVYYRVAGEGIEALRLLHTSRDVEGLF